MKIILIIYGSAFIASAVIGYFTIFKGKDV